MDQKELEYLQRIEDHAAQTGWVAPLTQEDKAYFAYLRQVSKRYNTFSKRILTEEPKFAQKRKDTEK